MSRKFVDCRETPSESGCTLAIYGEEDEVLRAAVQHAMDVHGHEEAGLADMIRNGLKDAPAGV